MSKNYLFGMHAVKEAFDNSAGTIHKLLLKKGLQKKAADDYIARAKKAKIPYIIVEQKELDRLAPGNNQGVVIVQNEIETISLDVFLKNVGTKDGVIVLMHEMNDPQNVGAIIRSAAAFGALGVIVPSRNQAPITDVVVKVSAGTVYQIPIVKVININTAISKLKENHFWIYGLTEKATDSIYKTEFDKRSVIIVGNEHSGIAQETLKQCDFKIKIPISKKVDSFNASVSAGIALYEFNRMSGTEPTLNVK